MTIAILAVFGVLLASDTALASPFVGRYGGYGGLGYGVPQGVLLASHAALAKPFIGGYGGLGYGGLGYGGYEVGCAEPVIPVAGGLVDCRSYTDSFIPGTSYCGYGTYGPAYGGRGYPLELYGYPGPFGRGCGCGGLGIY